MSDGIPLLDSWITKATVARGALAKAEERIRELEAELADMTAQAKTLALARDGFAARVAELERALEQRHGQIAAMLLDKAGRDYEHIPPDVEEREAD